MIEFSADNFDSLESEAQERAHEVSIFTVKAICDGLDADVDVVSVGFMKNLNMDITCESSGFLEALLLNIKRCEEDEAYELCLRARKWIKKLQDVEQ
jgi:hypothetical protein